MSAALKPYIPPPPKRRRRVAAMASSQPAYHRATPSSKTQLTPSPLRELPVQTQPSPQVRLLSHVRLVSSALAAALVSLSLASYGASVYVDRQINQATRRFNQLQRSEQQLTTVNAVLKNYMAQQAEESSTGLQPPKPDNVIFLRPTEPTAPVSQPSSAESHPLPLPSHQTPLGY
jgi:hypothetical protein